MTFTNYPSYPITSDQICVDWVQACYVEVTSASFLPFTAASNDTNTEAAANLNIAGEILGDCGANVAASASMTGSDGSSYTFTVTDDFYTMGGQNIVQNISRGADNYTLSVSMAAGDDAQSVAVHQNMTSGTGYNNVLTSSDSVSALSEAPNCTLSIASIEWVSYEEIDEWRGNIRASYKGIVRAEESCTAL